MLQSFTRNYEDNSTEAGFQFTFYCDLCRDGFKSSFVESETYRKGRGLLNLSRGAGVLGSLLGGRIGNLGWSLERGGDMLSERFSGMSPEWQKEHENAFEHAKNEAQRHFHRCHGCHQWVCDSCYNEDETALHRLRAAAGGVGGQGAGRGHAAKHRRAGRGADCLAR